MLADHKSRFVFVVFAIAILAGAVALVFGPQAPTKPTKQLEVSKVWSDSVDAPAGMVYYLIDVNATNAGTDVWHFDPSFFRLTSNTSSNYQYDPSYNETTIMTGSDLSPGGHMDGEVVFELPRNQSPSALVYSDPTGVSLELDSIPTVDGIASKFDPYVRHVFNGSDSWGDSLDIWGQIDNYTTPGYVFFTGQRIQVSFAFTYLKLPSDPNKIIIESVTNNNGFPESEVLAQPTALGSVATGADYPLPISLVGHGASAAVTLTLTVPPGPQHGPLSFTIQWGT
jgi:hypothetical protein